MHQKLCLVFWPIRSRSKQSEVVLDILSEEACMKIMKIREMKDDIKNIICSETKPIQKVKKFEKVKKLVSTV